jgi:hypothetical protein
MACLLITPRCLRAPYHRCSDPRALSIQHNISCNLLLAASLPFSVMFAIIATVPGAVVVAAATIFYLFLHLILQITQEKREPPAIATAIPFLSPILGMSRKKSKFYVELRQVVRWQALLLQRTYFRLKGQVSPANLHSSPARFKTVHCQFAGSHQSRAKTRKDSSFYADGCERFRSGI